MARLTDTDHAAIMVGALLRGLGRTTDVKREILAGLTPAEREELLAVDADARTIRDRANGE